MQILLTESQGTNAWSNADGSLWFYFVPHLFAWVYGPTFEVCPTSYDYWEITLDGWYVFIIDSILEIISKFSLDSFY